jgi:predicted MFS family arabinose efflux permease
MRGIGYAIGPWIGGQLFSGCSSVVLWSILSLFALIALISFHYGCMEKNK